MTRQAIPPARADNALLGLASRCAAMTVGGILFSVMAFGQLPDAPSAAQQTPVYHQEHSLSDDVDFLSNRQTITNKWLLIYFGTDFLSGAFDVEMSRHQGRCVEGGEGLPSHPTRWQLYKHNIPEQATALVFGFVATKIKMPKWILFPTEAWPVQSHIRAGLAWRNCW